MPSTCLPGLVLGTSTATTIGGDYRLRELVRLGDKDRIVDGSRRNSDYRRGGCPALVAPGGQRPWLQLALAQGAEDDATDREAHERPAHVNKNERPGICFEGREHGDGRVFNEQEGEPADERDLQTCNGARRIEPANQPCQRIVDDDRRNKCEQIGGDIVCPLDVGHRSGVKIQPLLAKDRVPAPADEEINHDENPDGEVIDSVAHKLWRRFPRLRDISVSKYKAWKAGMRS